GACNSRWAGVRTSCSVSLAVLTKGMASDSASCFPCRVSDKSLTRRVQSGTMVDDIRRSRSVCNKIAESAATLSGFDGLNHRIIVGINDGNISIAPVSNQYMPAISTDINTFRCVTHVNQSDYFIVV